MTDDQQPIDVEGVRQRCGFKSNDVASNWIRRAVKAGKLEQAERHGIKLFTREGNRLYWPGEIDAARELMPGSGNRTNHKLRRRNPVDDPSADH